MCFPCCVNATVPTEIFTYGYTLSLHDALPFWSFTFPWELQDIARTFGRANSAVTKWRTELEACGAASYRSGSWTLPVPEFFRRSAAPTSELQSLMLISYAVF